MAATRSTSTGWLQDGGGVTRSTSTGWSQQEVVSTGPVAIPLGHHRLDNQYMPIAASRLNGVLQ